MAPVDSSESNRCGEYRCQPLSGLHPRPAQVSNGSPPLAGGEEERACGPSVTRIACLFSEARQRLDNPAGPFENVSRKLCNPVSGLLSNTETAYFTIRDAILRGGERHPRWRATPGNSV